MNKSKKKYISSECFEEICGEYIERIKGLETDIVDYKQGKNIIHENDEFFYQLDLIYPSPIIILHSFNTNFDLLSSEIYKYTDFEDFEKNNFDILSQKHKGQYFRQDTRTKFQDYNSGNFPMWIYNILYWLGKKAVILNASLYDLRPSDSSPVFFYHTFLLSKVNYDTIDSLHLNQPNSFPTLPSIFGGQCIDYRHNLSFLSRNNRYNPTTLGGKLPPIHGKGDISQKNPWQMLDEKISTGQYVNPSTKLVEEIKSNEPRNPHKRSHKRRKYNTDRLSKSKKEKIYSQNCPL